MRFLPVLILCSPLSAQTLLIVGDDFNAQDVAQAETPTIDWLSSVGMTYTRHHGESACSVSRASLLTGVRAKEHLVGTVFHQDHTGWSMDVSGADILPKLVEGRKVFVGKWHVGEITNVWHPLDAGFDEWWGTMSNVRGQEDYFGWTETHVGPGVVESVFQTDYLTALQGCRVLLEVVQDTEFVMWWPQSIHIPEHWPPPELWSGNAPTQRLAMLEALDTVMGRVVREARARGYTVIFSSDNGGTHGDGGKGDLYEGSLLCPLVVSGPGVPHGVSDGLTTWLSVREWVENGWSEPSESYQVHDRFPGVEVFKPDKWDRSVNDRRWKLVVNDGGKSEELYDLQQDETTNLFPPSTKEQRVAYRRLRERVPE